MTTPTSLPLVILAGGAKKFEAVSESQHRLYGPKGVKIRFHGRPLIDVVIDRFRSSGFFDRIFIAGPVASYGESRSGAQVIDTDAEFGTNIRVALDTVVERLSPQAVAFTTCDVIPEPDQLRLLMDDYWSHVPLDFWYPLIRVPKDRKQLGAAADKRQYLVRMGRREKPVPVLPGHLVVIDPTAIRRWLIFDSFELAYRSRTKPVLTRFLYITSRVLIWLLARDLRNALRLRPPLLTVEVLYNAILFSDRLGRGKIKQKQIESHLRHLFVNEPHRRLFRKQRGRVPVLDALSLAKDIDTEEQAEELALEVG